MSNTVHQFTLGEFTGTILLEGFFRTGASATVFEGASADELATALDKYGLQPDAINLTVACLLLERDNQRILVDCGTGKQRQTKRLGRLLQSLDEAGIDPATITHVIITHRHFDHIDGIVDVNNKPTFQNAHYFMSRGCWQFLTQDVFKDDPKAENDDYQVWLREALFIIQSQLDLFEPDSELLSGVHAIATPGHTEHHISLHVISDDNHLIATSDAIIQPSHIEHPTWYPSWNVDGEQSQQSIHKLLMLAHKHHALMFCCHFDFPGLGHVKHENDEWSWEAL